MKKVFSFLGLKKPDEMEKSVHLKSIRLAWVYTVIFLVVWGLVESQTAKINQVSVNTLPIILLITQNFVLIFAQLFFRFRMTRGGNEEKESLLRYIVPVIAVIGIIIVALGLVSYFVMR
jgi:hypothetical protein